ncbi:uncharacterized protein LOC106010983, partial [Aplysia californica]|uniref:Uncharacterized protein LOC106010983 n=1 Tax=Aplysia californica TaxID=6500 RepID=A0ABM1AEG0_APLCA
MWLLPLILSSLSLAVTSGDFIKTCDEQQHTSVSVTPTGSVSLCVKTDYKPHVFVKAGIHWFRKGEEGNGFKIDWKKDDDSNFNITIVALNLTAGRTHDLKFYPFDGTRDRKNLTVTVHVVRATPQEPAETIPRTSAPPNSRVNQANSPKEQKEDNEDREKGGARQQGEDDGDHNETHESGCPDGSIVLGKFCAVFHKKRSSMADAHTVCQYNNMSLWADGLSSSDFDILKKNVDVITVWTGQRHKINCVIFKLNKELERKINCTMQRKFFCFSARQGLDGQTQTTTNPALTHSTTPQTQTQTHKTTSTVAMVTTASTPIYDTSSSPGAGDAATTGYPPTITSTTTTATTPTTTTALTTTTPPTTTTTTTTTTSTALRSTRSTRRYFRTTTTSKHTETESTVTSARCFPPSTVRGQCPLGWLTKRDNSCVAFLMTSSYLDGHNNCSKKGGKLFSIGETERPCVADFLNNIRYVWYGADQSWCKV